VAKKSARNSTESRLSALAKRYRVTDGRSFKLRDVDPGDTAGYDADAKTRAGELLDESTQSLAKAQDLLFACDRHALLVVLQAMDAAGKDGTIKHVMSGVNPQGCQVTSFKQPSPEELDHDYLWRCVLRLPERGRIGIFNRSYYEEVLVVRVHRAILEAQKLPPENVHKGIFDERLEDIAGFERYLGHNGTRVVKFFLHVSKREQKRRFLERLNTPEKNWKFSAGDVAEREHWDEYMDAYEAAVRATARPDAPWYVVPADNKWFTRLIVSSAIVTELGHLRARYPELDAEQRAEIAAAREQLEKGKGQAARRSRR